MNFYQYFELLTSKFGIVLVLIFISIVVVSMWLINLLLKAIVKKHPSKFTNDTRKTISFILVFLVSCLVMVGERLYYKTEIFTSDIIPLTIALGLLSMLAWEIIKRVIVYIGKYGIGTPILWIVNNIKKISTSENKEATIKEIAKEVITESQNVGAEAIKELVYTETRKWLNTFNLTETTKLDIFKKNSENYLKLIETLISGIADDPVGTAKYYLNFFIEKYQIK